MTVEEWLARQESASAAAIAAAVSATHLVHERPGFGYRVSPAAGSVLASPVSARWDPDPDYFYHWARDAGVVMMTAPALHNVDPAWDSRFAQYVAFSLAIARREGPAANPQRAATDAGHRKFLRDDDDLAALRGDAILGEPRVNADGTADFERWGRPQFDGPALRALSLFAWDGPETPQMTELIGIDLAHVLAHAAAPALGPWEEEPAALYGFTLLAQRAALRRGAERLPAHDVATALDRLESALDALWCETEGHLRASSAAAPGVSDAAVVLGALLEPTAATFGTGDPRMAATAAHIERWSLALYPIASEAHPLVGRWPQDVYFGGNPWLPTSLGFAEFHFHRGDIARGEAYLDALARLLPEAGALPEQLERASGAPISCRDLTWSHAALIAAADARRAAIRRQAGAGS